MKTSVIGRILEVTLAKNGYALVLYEAYFDETGDDGGFPIMAVGGYLVETGAARILETQWQTVLERYQLPYFLMVDCGPGNDIFKSIPKDSRIALQTELFKIINSHVEIGVVCATPLNRYETEALNIDAYSACLSHVAMQLLSLLDARHPNGDWSVSLYYEQGHKYAAKAYEYFRGMNFGPDKAPPNFGNYILEKARRWTPPIRSMN